MVNLSALVLWADSKSANLGVRALAAGMEILARRAWGPTCVVDFQDFEGRQSEVAINKRTLLRSLQPWGDPLRAKLRRYDVVIDSGAGDSFTDIYGPARVSGMIYVQHLALAAGRPLIFGPQTIGPFTRAWSAALATRVLKKATVVIPRDSLSAERVNALGRRPDLVATDVVFALPPTRPDSTGVARRDVIFNVSGLLWNSNRHVEAHAYRQACIELCNAIIGSGRTLTVLAHVLDNPSLDNDAPAAQALVRALQGSVEIVLPSDLSDVRGVLASGRVVIGARMHACLNALSVGTPAIPWAYSDKFAPLMSDLGWTYGVDLRTTPALVPPTLEQLHRLASSAAATQLADVRAHAERRIEGAVQVMRRIMAVEAEDA